MRSVPEAAAAYVGTAPCWRQEGTAAPFATVRAADGQVIGSTRFWNLERWAWPEGHHLMLRHAFETWDVLRVCLHTDARNERSRVATGRPGARFKAVLRAHRMAVDLPPSWPLSSRR